MGKLANGVGNQYTSHCTTSEHGVSSITTAAAVVMLDTPDSKVYESHSRKYLL